jgi:hypothetical protein
MGRPRSWRSACPTMPGLGLASRRRWLGPASARWCHVCGASGWCASATVTSVIGRAGGCRGGTTRADGCDGHRPGIPRRIGRSERPASRRRCCPPGATGAARAGSALRVPGTHGYLFLALGVAAMERDRRGFCPLLWRIWSFRAADFARAATSWDDADLVIWWRLSSPLSPLTIAGRRTIRPWAGVRPDWRRGGTTLDCTAWRAVCGAGRGRNVSKVRFCFAFWLNVSFFRHPRGEYPLEDTRIGGILHP